MADFISIAEEHLEHWRLSGEKSKLHQGLAILTQSIQDKQQASERHIEVMSELKVHRERFEQFDKRFEDIQHNMDKRFESMDKRFEDMFKFSERRFNQLGWIMGLGFTMLTVLISLFNLLG